MKKAARNMGVRVFAWSYVTISLRSIPRSGIALPYGMTGCLDGKQQKLPLTLRSKEEIIGRIVGASRIHEAEAKGLGLENGT